MQSEPKERRKDPRLPWIGDAECEYDGLVDRKPKRIMDLSVGGLFVGLITAPVPGTTVSVTFRLPGYEDPIVVTGKVCFSQHGMGMGIKFMDLKPEDKQKIEGALRETNWDERTPSLCSTLILREN